MTPPPVDPWSASAAGSVYRDAPGMLRENGWAQPYSVSTGPALNTPSTRAICSGTGSTSLAPGSNQTQLPILEAGQSLSIFSLQLTSAAGVGGDGSPCEVALYTSGNDSAAAGERRIVMTAHKDGPFFFAFELPMRIEGPAKVWADVINAGSSLTSFNRLLINYIRVDEEDTIT